MTTQPQLVRIIVTDTTGIVTEAVFQIPADWRYLRPFVHYGSLGACVTVSCVPGGELPDEDDDA